MRILELQQDHDLDSLQGAWNMLLSKSASNTIFLTWEWMSAWWAVYGVPGELAILLAFDERDTLCGIAPLRRRMARRFGRNVATLAFIGDGSADSDYLDFIIAAGEEQRVLPAFANHWTKELAEGAFLELNLLPETSPTIALLREAGGRKGFLWRETDIPCATLALPQDWPGYLKSLSPRFRTKIRSVLRNLEGRGEIQFEVCDDPKQLSELLPALFDLHTRRWAKESKPGVFGVSDKRLFYRTVSPLLLEKGWLTFSSLRWKGRILACQYGFTYRDSYFQLQEGYEPDCEHWNVGIALRAWSIQRLLSRGVREYDFLAGLGRHKSDWGGGGS